jgi:hypothetical protein
LTPADAELDPQVRAFIADVAATARVQDSPLRWLSLPENAASASRGIRSSSIRRPITS